MSLQILFFFKALSAWDIETASVHSPDPIKSMDLFVNLIKIGAEVPSLCSFCPSSIGFVEIPHVERISW